MSEPDEAIDPFFDDRQWAPFANGHVKCPQCQELLPVPVLARINGESEQALEVKPDMSEAWAHAWTHGGGS